MERWCNWYTKINHLKENYKEALNSLGKVPPFRKGFNFEVKLKNCTQVPKSRFYSVLLSMEQELKDQLTERFKKLWIERTKSEFGTPVIFAKKKMVLIQKTKGEKIISKLYLSLTRKNSVFTWNTEAHSAFVQVQSAVVSTFHIQNFMSRKLTGYQLNWTVLGKESLLHCQIVRIASFYYLWVQGNLQNEPQEHLIP
ncbi:hypothetical protein ACTFIW_003753 [Dictyostelium discoideum]